MSNLETDILPMSYCTGAVTGVFTQIEGDESVVRERAIAFLAKKLSNLPEDVLTKENEEFLVAKCKVVSIAPQLGCS